MNQRFPGHESTPGSVEFLRPDAQYQAFPRVQCDEGGAAVPGTWRRRLGADQETDHWKILASGKLTVCY